MTRTTTILLMIVTGLVVFIIMFAFKKSQPNGELIRSEMRREMSEQKRISDSVYYTARLEQKDSVIADILQRVAVKNNQTTQLKKDYEKIRPSIEPIGNNDLLRRANAWQPE